LSHTATSLTSDSDGAAASTRERVVAVELDGRRHEVRIHTAEPPWAELARRHRRRRKGLTGETTGAVVSPMQGTVLAVEVADGDRVEAGGVICVVEAMKMENEIVAHRDGVVAGLSLAPGEQISHGQLVCIVRDE
jgi:acetyl-CoA/propionyl-CoA carboxylase biotin carboxyl carrier protein